MGRTNPTFRDRINRFEDEWQPYRRALRLKHQEHFDDLLEMADQFAAAGMQNPVHAHQAILMSMLLAQEIERQQLEDRVVVLEDPTAMPYKLDISPYHREDGTFSLSTAGRYIAVEYAGADSSDGQQPSDEGTASDGQTTLEAGAGGQRVVAPMGEESPTNIVELAEEYLDSQDGGNGAEGDAEEARDNLVYWGQQVDEFEEGTAMHEMAVSERDEWREKLEAIDARGERREELRTKLLKRTSREFDPQGEWVKPAVVKGLSHALLGQRQEQLLVGIYSFPRDTDDLSKRDMVDAAKTIQAVAGDAVGDDDRVSGLWDALDTDTRRSITGALAGHNGALSADEISEELGDDGTDRPGTNIRKVRHAVDIQPYHSSSDGYTLSLAGRYVWTRYGPATPESVMDDREDVSDEAVGDRVQNEEQSSVDEENADTESDKSDTQQSGATEKEVDLSNFEIRE